MTTPKNPKARNAKKSPSKKHKKPIKWDTSWAEEQTAKNKARIEAGETFASQKRTGREKAPSAFRDPR